MVYTLPFSTRSTIPTWSAMRESLPYHLKKISIPASGLAEPGSHRLRDWNQFTPVPTPENLGRAPLSSSPHWSAHQETKMAHHSTRLEKPYQLQYVAPPTLPTWDWATATKFPLPLPKVMPYSNSFHKSSNSGESSSCSCSF